MLRIALFVAGFKIIRRTVLLNEVLKRARDEANADQDVRYVSLSDSFGFQSR
jgi:hypothetical protein